MLTEIVKCALVETVTDIGQLSESEKRELNRAVKRGWLSKGKAGPFPRLKTVYACPAFNFTANREAYIAEAMRYAELDRQDAERRLLSRFKEKLCASSQS